MPEMLNPFATLEKPIHESEEPVKNLFTMFNTLFHVAGVVTRPSRFVRSETHPGGRVRPLAARVERAKIFKRVQDARRMSADIVGGIKKSSASDEEKHASIREERRDARRDIAPHLAEAKMRDILAEQYLTQRPISVDIPDLGTQQARTFELVLPDQYRSHESQTEPTIFLIPGVSNDVECVGSLAFEMAMQGRKVVVIGYPESYNGRATPEFARAVETDVAFGPHATFFKTAIDRLQGDEKQIEVWGYSAGSVIAASILEDPAFQKKIKNATLLCLAGSVEQSTASMQSGALLELRSFKKSGSIASLMTTIDSTPPETTEHRRIREAVFGSLTKKCSHASDAWKRAHVDPNGRIIVVSCGKDRITKSDEIKGELTNNPQINVLDIPDGQHVTPLVRPAEVVSQILLLEHEQTVRP